MKIALARIYENRFNICIIYFRVLGRIILKKKDRVALVSLTFGQSSSCLVFAGKRYFAGSTWYVKSMKGIFVEGKRLVTRMSRAGQ